METIILALVPLLANLIAAGVKAQQEGTQTDFQAKVQALTDEWARKQVADAEFDKRFDDGSGANA